MKEIERLLRRDKQLDEITNAVEELTDAVTASVEHMASRGIGLMDVAEAELVNDIVTTVSDQHDKVGMDIDKLTAAAVALHDVVESAGLV